MKKKLERREATRERKALAAAHLEKSIEKELIERLKTRAYGDAPLNVNESVWQAVLDQSRGKSDKEKILEDGLEDLEDDESEEEDEEELEGEFEEDDEWGDREFVSDLSGDESEDGLSDREEAGEGRDMEEFGTDEDDEDVEESDGEEASKKGKRKAPPVPRKAKKRPEKKAKRTSSLFSLYFTPSKSYFIQRQVALVWKSSTRRNLYQQLGRCSHIRYLHCSIYYFHLPGYLASAIYIYIAFRALIVHVYKS